MFDAEQAAFVCDFIECLQCSNGAPFRLIDWQRDAITEFYGTLTEDETGAWIRQFRYLYLEMPKKNGKTELAGALGVYHLFADGEINGEVYVVAADRDNAGIAYAAAKWMIETCPALKKQARIVDSQKTIYDTTTGSKLKVLSSEAYSKHGYKPSCVIFDELHAQPNRDLWDVMTFGAGDAREQPVWIVLTTAGDDPDRGSIGWEVHEKALAILRYRQGQRGEDVYDNPTWLPIIYGLGLLTDEELETVDIYDEALWRRCNPSLGNTVKLSTIRQEAREAKQSEAAERLFRWLRLNQWIATKTVGWIPLTIYDKTQWNPEGAESWREAVKLLRGKTCYGGVDLSSTTDLTAFVLLFPPQRGLDKWVALPMAWVPTDDIQRRERRDHVPYRDWIRAGFLRGCEGDTMDYEDIVRVIEQAAADYDLRMVGFDPYLSRTITQRLGESLARRGVQVIEVPQGIRQISPPMKAMEEMIRKHEMLHVHNTAARWCFGNVRCVTDDNENIKPTKKRSTGRIDITVAWIIAAAVALMKHQTTLADAVARADYHM
ncbi:MAG: terminase large subunit [Clostridiales bacterium]|nr:terminase large subunit [Clostridiales bacterium]